MHIAYSALQNTTPNKPANHAAAIRQHSIRLEAYQATCSKYSKEIAAIQKYIPGWLPTYPVASPQPLSKGEGALISRDRPSPLFWRDLGEATI